MNICEQYLSTSNVGPRQIKMQKTSILLLLTVVRDELDNIIWQRVVSQY